MDVQMPVIDGYKCTHLLRRHLPYKSYVKDVPIVAMTASAIQGDKEKCKKAGMDDYLAKPVKSWTLERMLVRWSITKRNEASLPLGSGASDCSEGSEQCRSADVLGMAVNDYTTGVMKGIDITEDMEVFEDRPDLRTPRPLTRNASQESADFLAYHASLPQPDVHQQQQPLRRTEADELAMQSRHNKLMDSADGAGVTTPPTHALQPVMPLREALTTENVEKLQMEESLRRQGS